MMHPAMKLMTFLVLLAIVANSALAQDARKIVRQADQRVKGKTSYSKLTLRTERPTYFRELQLEAWTMGDSLSLIRILSPAKDRGTSFLRRNKEVWNWLPTIERTIKLPPSMMSQSWMGTDFTNDDLVKEASIVKDYDHRLIGSETVSGMDCHRIELIPHPEAAVVWGKIILTIEKKDYLLLKALYYDEDGELVNAMVGSDIRIMGGLRIPCRLEMSPLKKPGHKTVMTYTELRFDVPMNPENFTPQKLQQGK
jgi:outer membrane lipoprotein-sorting protein